MSPINSGDSADRRTEGSLHRDGSVRRVELPRRITDKWTRERTDAELRWLAKDFQGTCNGQRFDAEIRRRKEAPNEKGQR